MPSFAFWNVYRKDLVQMVSDAVSELDLDLIALCESKADPDEVVTALNGLGIGFYQYFPERANRRFQVFARLGSDELTVRLEGNRSTIYRVKLPGLPHFNLMLVHGESRLYSTPTSISHGLLEMARELEDVETRDAVLASVVIGDFNANPFDEGMISSAGFHAMMESSEVKKTQRTVQSKPRRYFYNPMWNFFGDQTKGPPGTYHRASSEVVEQQWHIFDQVIVRPELLVHFDPCRVEIVTKIKGKPLVQRSSMRPKSSLFSDHLPIYFELNY